MEKLSSTEIAKAQDKRVNAYFKTLKLADPSEVNKVVLPKTKKDPIPLSKTLRSE